jgi:glutamate decarboxylase
LTDVRQGERETKPVVQYHSPQELYKAMDFSLPRVGAGMEGNVEHAISLTKILIHMSKGTFELIKSTLEYSVNSWNPRFMDKLYAGTNPIGVISELLLAVLNSNAHVYHVSPVLTLMEIEVTKAVGQLLGMGEVYV